MIIWFGLIKDLKNEICFSFSYPINMLLWICVCCMYICLGFINFIVYSSLVDGIREYIGIALIIGGLFMEFCGYISFYTI